VGEGLGVRASSPHSRTTSDIDDDGVFEGRTSGVPKSIPSFRFSNELSVKGLPHLSSPPEGEENFAPILTFPQRGKELSPLALQGKCLRR